MLGHVGEGGALPGLCSVEILAPSMRCGRLPSRSDVNKCCRLVDHKSLYPHTFIICLLEIHCFSVAFSFVKNFYVFKIYVSENVLFYMFMCLKIFGKLFSIFFNVFKIFGKRFSTPQAYNTYFFEHFSHAPGVIDHKPFENNQLIYQALTPPPAGSTPPFSSVPAAAGSLAACMLGAADCLWLLAGCC